MKLNRLRNVLIASGILVAGVAFCLIFSPLISQPSPPDPCSLLPPLSQETIQAAHDAGISIHIDNPKDGSKSHGSLVAISTTNIDLKSNASYVQVWSDGKLLLDRLSAKQFVLPSTKRDEHFSICLTLIDANTDREIGVRASLQFIAENRGPDELDFSGDPLGQIFFIVLFVGVAICSSPLVILIGGGIFLLMFGYWLVTPNKRKNKNKKKKRGPPPDEPDDESDPTLPV